MAVANSVWCKSLSWNNTTYDASTGGIIFVEYDHSCNLLDDFVADDLYPKYSAATQYGLTVRARIRDVKVTTQPGAASSNLVAVVKGASDYTKTFANMVLVSVRGSQDSNGYGYCELTWRHRSADGTTNPIS